MSVRLTVPVKLLRGAIVIVELAITDARTAGEVAPIVKSLNEVSALKNSPMDLAAASGLERAVRLQFVSIVLVHE
jgi:hypothetical protein